ncbi:unnamed protein product [Phytomonas sp. EM1]|nr:unnamed protein product [Phytomonas sp. EM1]|eukprot:CCW61584.1 unnamed protein product [Phytomonas sp. isolate EM1]
MNDADSQVEGYFYEECLRVEKASASWSFAMRSVRILWTCFGATNPKIRHSRCKC